MEAILAALVNLGLGGLMGAALIWFLHYLVTRTLPEMTRCFREEVHGERDLRLKEHQAMLAALDRLAEQIRREHDIILDRLDYGFKEMLNEVVENRAALGLKPQGKPAPAEEPRRPRPPRPQD
jgi:hypothetical protein